MERSDEGNPEQRRTEGQTTETIVADSIGNSYRITQMSTVTNHIPTMRRIEVCSTNAEGATTVFETYVCNDGVIADEAIIDYIYVDITDPERYDTSGNRPPRICLTPILLMTRNQLDNPCYAQFIHQWYSHQRNVRLEVYGRTVPLPITREQAAEIVGLPTPCLRGNNDPEIICAICLQPFEDANEDLKELPCGHIFHYQCILRSTQLQNLCPICRRPYDSRAGQQREVR
ncbi:hypothetical protein SUGI_0700580 [Cryptomeria japonica]|nr:hypothetical protein SUGI_0700580 [Cryptomeria japonica]